MGKMMDARMLFGTERFDTLDHAYLLLHSVEELSRAGLIFVAGHQLHHVVANLGLDVVAEDVASDASSQLHH